MSENPSNSINKSQKLPQYKGKLNPTEISAGMNAANRNAERLFNSASILFDNGDYASAVSLAILAIEEAGKVSNLRSIALTSDDSLLKEYWKEYHMHTEKTKLWNLVDYIPKDKDTVQLEDFRCIFAPDNMSSYQLDQIKQIGFYTDCLGKAHWSIPEEIIDERFAKDMLRIARLRCQKNKTISVKEIELWVESLSPVWMKSMDEMKQGLLNWHAKMQEAGLIDQTDHFDEFITTGMSIRRDNNE